MPPNTACSGWWVRAAFSGKLLTEGTSMARGAPALPTTANADRWAAALAEYSTGFQEEK